MSGGIGGPYEHIWGAFGSGGIGGTLDPPIFAAELSGNLIERTKLTVGSYTRAGNATYIDPADGLVKTKTANNERYEADGLLHEGAAENVITNPNTFRAAASNWANAD